jgi:serine/threonine protein kinase
MEEQRNSMDLLNNIFVRVLVVGRDAKQIPYDKRIYRCLVIYPAGRPIHKYQSPLELLEALRDAIKAHQSLHSKGKILHRDVSENNIIRVSVNIGDINNN